MQNREAKAIQREIRKNIQGTNSDGKETRTQISDLDQKEEINIQPEKSEETRIQKMRRGLGTSGMTLNVGIIEVPEGEQEQEIENLSDK